MSTAAEAIRVAEHVFAAAVINHERTSWQNHGPLVTPEQVRRDR